VADDGSKVSVPPLPITNPTQQRRHDQAVLRRKLRQQLA
jgi:hypothetical protein